MYGINIEILLQNRTPPSIYIIMTVSFCSFFLKIISYSDDDPNVNFLVSIKTVYKNKCNNESVRIESNTLNLFLVMKVKHEKMKSKTKVISLTIIKNAREKTWTWESTFFHKIRIEKMFVIDFLMPSKL